MAGFFLLAVRRTPLSEVPEAAPLFFVKQIMKLAPRCRARDTQATQSVQKPEFDDERTVQN